MYALLLIYIRQHLYYTNIDAKNHNKQVCNTINTMPSKLEALDIFHPNWPSSFIVPNDPKKTAGLAKEIHLKVVMVVKLCATNINIADGLVNGAE